MFSNLSSKVGSYLGDVFGKSPAKIGNKITSPKSIKRAKMSEDSSEDSSEEVFEHYSSHLAPALRLSLGEELLCINVVETQIHSAKDKEQKKKNNKVKIKLAKKKKNPTEDEDESSNKDKEQNAENKTPKVYIKAKGCYNFFTQKVRLQIVASKKIKPVSHRLRYQENDIPKFIVRDVTDESLQSSHWRNLEVAINEVDRHVFYNTFTLVYKYELIDENNEASEEATDDSWRNSKCYESKLQFEIPLVKEATPIKFTALPQFRPEKRIVKLFENDFKPVNNDMESFLMEIDDHCRLPLPDRPYRENLKMFEIAQSIEDLEGQRDLLQMKMKNVLVYLNGYDEDNFDDLLAARQHYQNQRSRDNKYYFEIPQEHAILLKKIDVKEISVNMEYRLEYRRDGPKDIIVTGNIVKVDANRVFIKTYFDFGKSSLKIPLIYFEFNRTSTRASMNALKSIGPNLFRYLSDFAKLPIRQKHEQSKCSSTFESKDFVWYNPQMANNNEQQTAIKNIVNCTAFPFPYIIFGPPGTGKTSTLVECVAQISKLKPDAKILITAQSNSACDEIGTRLLETVSLSKILRIYPSSLEPDKKDYLNKNLLLSSNKRNKNIGWPTKEEFDYFKIVIITLMSSSRLVQSDIKKGHFDYIFLDECGAASEPESLVPLLGLGVKTIKDEDDFEYEAPEQEITANIVILGDHKQLGAVINSSFAVTMGLGVSLMERMMTKERYKPNPEYNTNYVTQLLDNYRCHPAILQFSNVHFYNNMLRSKVDEELRTFAEKWDNLPKLGFPILFHCSKKPSKVDPNGTSSHNDEEVEKVKFYVNNLLTRRINGKKVKKSDIGIVCPYLAQLRKLRKALNGGYRGEIEIGTAEYYQGREKKIIIISTVKSGTGIGFLKNEKRLNVVLTRAQSLMIVVGNPETLQRDPLWRSFVHFCHENQAIVGDNYNLTSLSAEDAETVTQMSEALMNNQQEEAVGPAPKTTVSDLKEQMKKLQEMMKTF